MQQFPMMSHGQRRRCGVQEVCQLSLQQRRTIVALRAASLSQQRQAVGKQDTPSTLFCPPQASLASCERTYQQVTVSPKGQTACFLHASHAPYTPLRTIVIMATPGKSSGHPAIDRKVNKQNQYIKNSCRKTLLLLLFTFQPVG